MSARNLDFLINTKKWNPYCIRHSAITSDSDFLPEYALKKKVRWSMNSKQGSRYIKRRMGNDLKQKILIQNGIITEHEIEKKPSVLNCPRCSLVNAVDNKYCSKCSYPLIPSAFDEIKAAENMKFRAIEERFNDMQSMLEKLISGLSRQQTNSSKYYCTIVVFFWGRKGEPMNQLYQNSNGYPRLLGFLSLESCLYLALSAAESKSILKDSETGILDFLGSFIFKFSVIFFSESNPQVHHEFQVLNPLV